MSYHMMFFFFFLKPIYDVYWVSSIDNWVRVGLGYNNNDNNNTLYRHTYLL